MSTVPQQTGWIGWIGFAAIILILNGAFSALQAFVALLGSNTYYTITEEGLFLFDITGWGWWNLIIGLLLALTGLALFAGQSWARIDPKERRLPSQRIWALAFDAHNQNVLFVGSHSAGVYVVPRSNDTLSSAQQER